MTHTPVIHLVPLTRADLARLSQDPDEFARSREVRLAVVRDALIPLAEQSGRFYDDAGVEAPWGAYLAVDDTDAQVVGVCSFKGQPRDDGAVEIAYATFPPYEGRGVASAMAAQLVAIARRCADVEVVVAHTLREENASVRLLRRLRFELVGDVIDDPADGVVWRWELAADPQAV